MNKPIVATRISRARVGRDAWVYKLSGPVYYEQRGENLSTVYVVIQTFWNEASKQSAVVVYPSDEKGDVLSFSELPGSHTGDADHDRVIREAGWTLDPKSVKREAPSGDELRECVGIHTHPPGHVSSAEDFPTQSAAVEHAYSQRNGEQMFVYHEGGKFHLAAPGQEPVGATPIRTFRRPEEYGFAEAEVREFATQDEAVQHARTQPGGEEMFIYYEQSKFLLVAAGKQPVHAIPVRAISSRVIPARQHEPEAREDTAPVIYEQGAQPSGGAAWPAPETLAREHVQTTVVGEQPAPQQGDCLPWVRVTRDPERYAACLANAQRIGPIDNARKVYDLLAPTLAKEDQEVLLVVLVDVRRQLRGVAEVHRGQRSSVGVSAADVLRVVIVTGAEGYVLVHNHPSGASRPSPADRDLTAKVEAATKPYGKDITFIDHVIVAPPTGFYSIKEDKAYRVK
jgi:hypothetical protein